MLHAANEIFKLLNPPIIIEGSSQMYPVSVYDGKGNLKKVLGSEELHKRHWKTFEDGEIGIYSRLKGRRTKPVLSFGVDHEQEEVRDE